MKRYEEHNSESSFNSFTKYQAIMFNLKVFMFKEILLSSSKSLKNAALERAQVMYFCFLLTWRTVRFLVDKTSSLSFFYRKNVHISSNFFPLGRKSLLFDIYCSPSMYGLLTENTCYTLTNFCKKEIKRINTDLGIVDVEAFHFRIVFPVFCTWTHFILISITSVGTSSTVWNEEKREFLRDDLM